MIMATASRGVMPHTVHNLRINACTMLHCITTPPPIATAKGQTHRSGAQKCKKPTTFIAQRSRALLELQPQPDKTGDTGRVRTQAQPNTQKQHALERPQRCAAIGAVYDEVAGASCQHPAAHMLKNKMQCLLIVLQTTPACLGGIDSHHRWHLRHRRRGPGNA